MKKISYTKKNHKRHASIDECSICGQHEIVEGIWDGITREVHRTWEKNATYQYSHGLCPECFKAQIDELEKIK